jgi:hypothetical protein
MQAKSSNHERDQQERVAFMIKLEQQDIADLHEQGLVCTRARLEPVEDPPGWYQLRLDMTKVQESYLLHKRRGKPRLFGRLDTARDFVEVWFPELETLEVLLRRPKEQ